MARRVGFGGTRRARPAPEPTSPRDEIAARIAEARDRAGAARPTAKPTSLVFLVLLAPLVFAAIGIWLLLDEVRFSQVALGTQGRVIGVEADTSGDGVSYWPTIRFRSVDGRTYEAPTHVGSSEFDYAIGTELAILYDPAAPDEVRIDSFWSLWLLPLGFTTIGSVLFVVMLLVFVRQARTPREGSGA